MERLLVQDAILLMQCWVGFSNILFGIFASICLWVSCCVCVWFSPLYFYLVMIQGYAILVELTENFPSFAMFFNRNYLFFASLIQCAQRFSGHCALFGFLFPIKFLLWLLVFVEFQFLFESILVTQFFLQNNIFQLIFPICFI